ncbi:MAG: PSD1 and planctomycete cytochrome C domain-containing protein [Planctomycetota bacterium]|nr:PSD1 and planctomycete cytochrome C domain-containing protein [Planctomycetota bacterium]
MVHLRLLAITGMTLLSAWVCSASEKDQEVAAFFDERIKPLLEKCVLCHGDRKQMARLRLDSQDGLMAGSRSGPVVIPGDPEHSRLIQAVQGAADCTIPFDQKLTKDQVSDLHLWIRNGVSWPARSRLIRSHQSNSAHWAFQPISRVTIPSVTRSGPTISAIDHFIRKHLEQEGIRPSREADRQTLLRRVTLDLTGLPASLDERVAFVNDTDFRAYERLVDRLLASPHFGERWGRHWLDGARYADSGGNEGDSFRSVWAFREWVIDALNSDMAFDQFVIQQIAGDLLPQPTLKKRIATAFYHNNTAANRLEGVVQRVNKTGSVFMGITIGCAQCHAHKFDPVSQREYYQLFAFFNQSDDPPLKLEIPIHETLRTRFRHKVDQLVEKRNEYQKRFAQKVSYWVLQMTPEQIAEWPDELQTILAVPESERSSDQRQMLLEAYGKTIPEYAVLKRSIQAHKQHEEAMDAIPVLSKSKARRKTNVFIRGDFSNAGDEVEPGVPEVLPPLPEREIHTRLDLAQWLVSPEHPLTARVAVNRIWQHYFGTGLVDTENDFGLQGTRPSHPELLDWLARDFIDNGWQVKRLHRMIVMSDTYRQSSHTRPDLEQKDPSNRWLARQRRLRLEAEVIRDQALTVSGLLNRQIGGPSVFPYQADGVMEGRADKSTWIADVGASVYRRGLYIHFWRLTPHPYMKLFDVPDASESCTRRQRSNTPMQALALLNHRWFIECARVLTWRLLESSGQQDRIRLLFQLCLGREPTTSERTILDELLQLQRVHFARNLEDAKTVMGRNPPGVSVIDVREAAAWMALTRSLLNLDEFITRE